jgi:acyl-CoA thioester hydrolase
MRASGVLRIEIPVKVPFFDVDSMDVVWHGHYVKYLELARCALLERIGHDYRQMKDSGYLWPIVDLQLRYVRAARFGQQLVVRADLVEWINRLKVHYRVLDAETGERITLASTVQVAVSAMSGELQLESPAVFTEAVERALAASHGNEGAPA